MEVGIVSNVEKVFTRRRDELVKCRLLLISPLGLAGTEQGGGVFGYRNRNLEAVWESHYPQGYEAGFELMAGGGTGTLMIGERRYAVMPPSGECLVYEAREFPGRARMEDHIRSLLPVMG